MVQLKLLDTISRENKAKELDNKRCITGRYMQLALRGATIG